MKMKPIDFLVRLGFTIALIFFIINAVTVLGRHTLDVKKINPEKVHLYENLSISNFNEVQSIYNHSYRIPCKTVESCEDYLILDRIFYPNGISGIYDVPN